MNRNKGIYYKRKGNVMKVIIDGDYMGIMMKDETVYEGQHIDYRSFIKGWSAHAGTKKEWTAMINDNGVNRKEVL